MSNYTKQRTEKVKTIIASHYNGETIESSITELLADLMHACGSVHSMMFEHALKQAREHYRVEARFAKTN